MKNSFQKLILLALAILSVNSLISCAPKGGPAAGGDQFGAAKGTQDSGGGTGIDNKVFESYIVDPTALASFKNYVAPIFNNMKTDDGLPNQGGTLVASLKTWYVAPVELNKISKDLLGISFVNSSTQQIARQTTKEIWIDKKIFDVMSEQDQAELILHEMIMTMYFYKFIPVANFCQKASATATTSMSSNDCVRFSAAFDKAVPPEAPRALNEQDNANIRAVTGWLKLHGHESFTLSEFNRVCLDHGFDKRFFSHDTNSKENLKEVKISRTELFRAVKAAELTGQMPEVCTGLTTNASENCSTHVIETSRDFFGIKLPSLSLDITGTSGSTHFSLTPGEETTLVPQPTGNGDYVYLFFNVEYREKNKIGDRVAMQILSFAKDSSTPQSTALLLQSVTIKMGMIVSIDKTKTPVCTVSVPKAQNLFDDSILVHRAGVKMNLAEQMNLMVPAMTACMANNVE